MQTDIIIDWSDKKILIAEDEIANYQLLISILKRTNVQTLWAKTGEEALRIYHDTENLSAGIIDIKMPDMDGYDFLKQLQKEHTSTKLPPFIAHTAFNYNNTRKTIMEAGFCGCLFKPIRPQELFSLLNPFLSH
ncbi:response regulator [Marinilabiliaceae bacterium JC017]|nr:response regulator [Marinilabiliaceae bacterium JC017]